VEDEMMRIWFQKMCFSFYLRFVAFQVVELELLGQNHIVLVLELARALLAAILLHFLGVYGHFNQFL